MLQCIIHVIDYNDTAKHHCILMSESLLLYINGCVNL